MGKRTVGSISDSVHNKLPSSAYGDVFGPAGAADSAIVLFDGVSGKLIKNSNTLLSTDGTFALNSNLLVPTQAAVKTYVDSKISLSSNNYIETMNKNPFSDSQSISGSIGAQFISPFTKSISQVWFYNRSGVGTNYPVQVSLYETSTPLSNTPTFTKLAQSGNIDTTTIGYKALTGLNIPIVQGYGYFIMLSRAPTGGTTSPTVLARTGGFNSVNGAISGTNLADATPASFSTNVTAATVGTWTAGTPTGSIIWASLFCQ